MKTLRGRRALVTGAASGIGRAIARALAREGTHLFLLDVDEAGLAAVAKEARELGVEVIDRCCDVSDPDQIEARVGELIECWGGLEILVNNAGVLWYDRTDLMTSEHWEQILRVNLLAPVRFIEKLLPLLRSQEEAHILNVSSVAGLVPKRKMAAYVTTKFGLVGLSLGLRAEFGPEGLGVTALCPGAVATGLVERARAEGLTRTSGPKPSQMISPEHVAERAIDAIRRNRGVVPVGRNAHLLWLVYRISPRIFDWYHWSSARRRRRRRTSGLTPPP